MRIKMCGDTCVQITDRASGITTVGTGSATHVIKERYKKLKSQLNFKNHVFFFLIHFQIERKLLVMQHKKCSTNY